MSIGDAGLPLYNQKKGHFMKYLFILLTLMSCSSRKNMGFEDPNISADLWNHGFELPEKDVVLHRKELLRLLPVKKGDAIADVGAGTGSFEKSLSELVGTEGKVYAVEVASAFIPYMENRFEKEKLTNVKVVRGKSDQTTLKKESVNVVMVVDTYHHFDKPDEMIRDFHKILKADGHLVIVDFRKGPQARPWVNSHVYMTMEECIQVVTKNGFRLLREEKTPFLETFQLTFQKVP